MNVQRRSRSPLVNVLIVIALALAAIAWFFLEDTPRFIVSLIAIAAALVAVYLQRRAEP